MQLSMETVVLRNKFGDETAIRMLKEGGFDGIDYSFYWPGTPERNMLGEDYISRAREVKSYLKAMDMNCLQAHAPLNPRPVASLELSDPTCLELIRSIEFSGILGVKTLVVHAITPPEGRELIEYNLEFYRFLEPFAREAGVRIAVENLFGPPLERPEQMTEILQNLNSEQFTGCLDVGHSMYSGIKPQDFLRSVPRGLITVLHIQDQQLGKRQDMHFPPFFYEIEWNEFLKVLKEYGYSGEMNLEVFAYLWRFPNELLPAALTFAAQIGRELIRRFENDI